MGVSCLCLRADLSFVSTRPTILNVDSQLAPARSTIRFDSKPPPRYPFPVCCYLEFVGKYTKGTSVRYTSGRRSSLAVIHGPLVANTTSNEVDVVFFAEGALVVYTAASILTWGNETSDRNGNRKNHTSTGFWVFIRGAVTKCPTRRLTHARKLQVGSVNYVCDFSFSMHAFTFGVPSDMVLQKAIWNFEAYSMSWPFECYGMGILSC